jgi:carbonic anhydrase
MTLSLIESVTDAAYALATRCTQDYIQWLDIDLSYQEVDEELAAFRTMYGKPTGGYMLAFYDGDLAGGAGLRQFSETVCEMKRLFVYERWRGLGIGRSLAISIIELGRSRGYREMRLDTLARLRQANRLYERLGFVDIPPYRHNPDPTARFMSLLLAT